MDIEQARDFVRDNHRAVLATRTPTGGLQQTPVLVTVDDAGVFVVSSRETAYKTRNLRRDPWAQLCVVPDGFFGSWVWVEGRVEVVGLPDAMGGLVDYYRSVNGEHDDWDDYRAAMARERRVLLRLTAERVGPTRQG
ncbi:PPOX class F420-dependent oxidoreductase [Nocardioides sp. HDW12B]|uniref:PPOX class F420-dependent oxidoreductase n=1 Tax=Nocardioides sp. HDW12B TaxID=2714939 RepID=UPI001408992C|nr:PPOX class F420-dependent oxidoreductase [Nocardioides sp. HDW12B]QIK65041.1 PPOX class F420-dependent oxidoreductase [Nocardioides sp. HDW12B]